MNATLDGVFCPGAGSVRSKTSSQSTVKQAFRNEFADVANLLTRHVRCRLTFERIGNAGRFSMTQWDEQGRCHCSQARRECIHHPLKIFSSVLHQTGPDIFFILGDGMTNKFTVLVALPVVAGLVTACGGGGGRSAAPKATQLGAPAPKPKNVATPVPTPKTDLTPVPTPKNVANPALKNPNGKAHFVFVPRAGLVFAEVTAANGRTSSPALVEVSQTASSKTIRYQGPSRLINADSIPIDEEKSEPGVSIYGEKDKLLLGAITSAGSTSLEYSEIGLIGDHRQAVSNVGAYHAGQLTRADQLPTGVTATYTGVFSGAGGAVGDVSGGLGGKANITANFGSGDVKGQVSDLRGGLLGFTRQDYGLSIQGKITGNAYAGTAGFTDKDGKRSPSEAVTSSAMSGGFYGPNGVETAGALRIEGSPGEGISKKPHVIVGAFGAKRDFPQTSAKPKQ